MSRVRVGVRLSAGVAALLALLVICVGVGVNRLGVIREGAADLAAAQITTRLAVQVKFRSADFNGWQTAYAFDVLRSAPNATADTSDGTAEDTSTQAVAVFSAAEEVSHNVQTVSAGAEEMAPTASRSSSPKVTSPPSPSAVSPM